MKIKVKQEFVEQLGHGTNIFEANGGMASEVIVKAKQESEERGTNMFETNDRETSVEEVCTVFVEVDVKKEQLESSEDTLGQLLNQYLDARGRGEDEKQSPRNRLINFAIMSDCVLSNFPIGKVFKVSTKIHIFKKKKQ